ncbi:RING finger protein 37 isoform X2 [Electrophorus electricus]|uniref:RING finger protein 37 isoform X2 n=1 Tax=Electrophorus electricus TaxID=8005 RepID=UPI0015D04DD0|nr:RING finger protein 37 isoform X2 [Electrophorus electricus]
MVVNLCLPSFQTTAHCNKLSADGCDVSNLLSGDPVARRRGFRLEYFLRPPLHVTLHFQVRVELCRVDVELWPCGMDKGSSPRRLELLTCPDFHAKTECEEDGRFKLVGRCEMREEVLVCFRHSNFHHRAPFHAPPPEPAAYGKQQELWSRGPESLCSVGQLRISVPCGGAASALGIKSLAVWGVPARCCPTSEVEKIRKAHLDSLKPEPSAFPLPLPVSVSNISPRSDPAPSEMTVPEEFLDPLTLELMVLPMILPSGVVVDSSTLEEYQKQEATWGRLPNDPFTGVPFTKDSKPLPNPHLKSRIDSLRLKTGCSGVMGRNGLLNKPQPSRLVIISKPETPTCSIDSISVQSSQAGPSEMENLQVHSKGYKNTEQQPKHVINKDKNLSRLGNPKVQFRSCVERKGFILGSVFETHNIRKENIAHSIKRKYQSTLSSTKSKSAAYSPLSNKMPRTDASLTLPTETDSSQASHEQRLSDSLDQALSSALYGLPTYTSQSPPESDTTAGPSSCSSCSCSLTVFSMGPLTYSLPCGHLLCRPCLDLKLPRQSQRLPVTCPTLATKTAWTS